MRTKLDPIDPLMGQSPIMIVDDNTENRGLLRSTLEWAGFLNILGFANAEEALGALPEFDPHLVILDLMMPGMNGYQFLEKIRGESPAGSFLPILIFTADLTSDAKIRALGLGASDFLTKPGDAIEILLKVRNFLRMRKLYGEIQDHNEVLEARVRRRTEHLAVARREAVELLANACEYRDDDTGQHTHRVGELSANIALTMGLDTDYVEAIRLVAPLHDVGKIAISDDILHKPGPLTPNEFATMKRHVGIGADLLAKKSSPLLQLATQIARYHHERWDGTGYEEGLAGEAIPLVARIVTVADSFDAMTNDRPYRKGRSPDEALRELKKMSGSQFDPAVVEALASYLNPAVGDQEKKVA